MFCFFLSFLNSHNPIVIYDFSEYAAPTLSLNVQSKCPYVYISMCIYSPVFKLEMFEGSLGWSKELPKKI